MSTAQSVLVTYGLVVLTYGLGLGIPLAFTRSSASRAPRHLVTAHLSALMQAPIALGLAFALGIVSFDSALAVVAACLVTAGMLVETVGGTLNWLQGVGDQFQEKGAGFRLNALTGPLAIPGTFIITLVVLTRL